MWTVNIMLLLISTVAFAWGGWEKRSLKKADFEVLSPHFLLLKVGIFNNKGVLKTVFSDEEIKDACEKIPIVQGWITHRLSSNETLSKKHGKRLGKDLKKMSKTTCIKAFELDIEPLHFFSRWIRDFLEGVKHECNNLEIRLFIPPLFNRSIIGVTWNNELESILSVVDGIDIMLYDTGISEIRVYEELVRYNLKQTLSILKKWPNKKVYLGLPAYKDKTRLHKLEIENLANIKQIFFNLPSQLKKVFCLKNVDLSYYALWTMDKNDIQEIKLIEGRRQKECPN